MIKQILEIVQKKSKLRIRYLEEILFLPESEIIKTVRSNGEQYNLFVDWKNEFLYFVDNKLIYSGVVRINKKGFGFIKSDNLNHSDDYFVCKKDLNNAISTDRVLFTVEVDQDNKTLAKIINIISRTKKNLIGTMEKSFCGRFLDFVASDSDFQNYRIVLVNKKEYKLQQDQIVLIKLSNVKENKLFAYIEEIIGNANKAVDRILSIAYENNIEIKFSEATLKQANEVAFLSNAEKNRRLKNAIFDLPIVTIDGDDSKDLDDAICVIENGDGTFKLVVAIADVSYYVKPKTELDVCALKKGNSTYLANKVIPMLPEVLSNGVCSLNPNEEKFCMVCEIIMDQNGNHLSSKLYESIMISKARLTYKNVNKYFNGEKVDIDQNIGDMLNSALKLHNILETKKAKMGSIDFDIIEPKIILDKDSNVADIVLNDRGIGERLIENFMVAANNEVAKIMAKSKKPFLFRNHEKPKTENIVEWHTLLKSLGIISGLDLSKNLFNPIDIKKALDNINQTIDDENKKNVICITLLKYMEKAKYESVNLGHFGLALDYYTHFTSPIRRYSDLLVHRYIKMFYLKNTNQRYDEQLVRNFIDRACNIINETEKNSINAEREVNKVCMVEYMQDKVGQEYIGIISAVLKFGMFVQIEKGIEGLVHISNMDQPVLNDLGTEYKVKSKIYKLGQFVKIKVLSSDIKKRAINFVLIE